MFCQARSCSKVRLFVEHESGAKVTNRVPCVPFRPARGVRQSREPFSPYAELFGARALARCGRKLHDEGRAPTQFALAPDPAVHGFHHLLHDGQAQAG